jgi:hypothetical protein
VRALPTYARSYRLIQAWTDEGTALFPCCSSRQSFHLIQANLVPVRVIKITERDCGATLRDRELSDEPDFHSSLSEQCALALNIIYANSQNVARTLLT